MALKVCFENREKITGSLLYSNHSKRITRSIIAATIFFGSIGRSASFVRVGGRQSVKRFSYKNSKSHESSHFGDIRLISQNFSCSSSFRRQFPSRFLTTTSMTAIKNEVDAGFVADNLASVLEKIDKTGKSSTTRLIAVSKTKPNSLLMEAYNAGQRYFGENYVQELCSKSPALPKDIKWHFIGPLQSNKAALLVKTVGLEQLHCVETVATLKLAKKLNKAVLDLKSEDGSSENKKQKLNIYLQVNTSGEESKSGLKPGDELTTLASSIIEECDQLNISGLMTIGAPGDMTCFDTLVGCRNKLAEDLGLKEDDLDLSMGMSSDFEEAIKRGATNVRVGSTIFGARDYSQK